LLILVAALISGLLLAIPIAAQTINGSISGLVTDPNGAAIAAAIVKVINVDTGAARDAVTNEEGLYLVQGLPVGVYTVEVEKSGFGSGTNRAQVSPGTNAEINFKLSAGPVTAQVEVTDKGCILETRCRVVVSVRRSL